MNIFSVESALFSVSTKVITYTSSELLERVDYDDEEYGEDKLLPDQGSERYPVSYDIAITYGKRFLRKLRDVNSTVFQREKTIVEEEVELFLLASDKITNRDLLSVKVLQFEAAPNRETTVLVDLTLANSAENQLRQALTSLEQGFLNRQPVTATELLESNEPVPLPSSLPDSSTPEASLEVKDSISSSHDQSLDCPVLVPVIDGTVLCTENNRPGSICQYSCEEGTTMAGPDQIRCDRDGRWDAEPPSCRKVYCRPHLDAEEFPNGVILCTDHNRFSSECEFYCNGGYKRVGTFTSVCNTEGGWTKPNPVCELIPVDCVISYTEWSECLNGVREEQGFIAQEAVGTGTPCPTFIPNREEECVHCEVDWGEWESCLNGGRTRRQVIITPSVGAGNPCPALQQETEACVDCQVLWGKWSGCENGVRTRSQQVSVETVGAGMPCPDLSVDIENCVDCEVSWEEWSSCANGTRSRKQYISAERIGAGAECPDLRTQSQACADCEWEWGDFGTCTNGQMIRREEIVTQQMGAGKPCPTPLQKETEECADCEVVWVEWSECINGERSRNQEVTRHQLGTGAACPDLLTATENCGPTTAPSTNSLLCRYTRDVIGYDKLREKRDILFLGDESGSVGWVNYEKIKDHFKAVARHVYGGVSSDGAQISVMSFATWSRILFDFDDNSDADAVVTAIDRATFKGGRRSNIGRSLDDANTWLFQQSAGMREFPGLSKNFTHEILLVTDGCRTSPGGYYFLRSIKALKKRGILLTVLGVDSPDPSCRGALEHMKVDDTPVYEVGSWSSLDDFNEAINQGLCQD